MVRFNFHIKVKNVLKYKQKNRELFKMNEMDK